VDQSLTRKAQQEPEGEMEETETAAAAEALALSVAIRACVIKSGVSAFSAVGELEKKPR
jgi:hypothetical protein